MYFNRQHKRSTTIHPTQLEEDWEAEDLELQSSILNPNDEEKDSDFLADDDVHADVSDDEDPTSDKDGEDNTNATMDEFDDDGY